MFRAEFIFRARRAISTKSYRDIGKHSTPGAGLRALSLWRSNDWNAGSVSGQHLQLPSCDTLFCRVGYLGTDQCWSGARKEEERIVLVSTVANPGTAGDTTHCDSVIQEAALAAARRTAR